MARKGNPVANPLKGRQSYVVNTSQPKHPVKSPTAGKIAAQGKIGGTLAGGGVASRVQRLPPAKLPVVGPKRKAVSVTTLTYRHKS